MLPSQAVEAKAGTPVGVTVVDDPAGPGSDAAGGRTADKVEKT